MADDYGTKEWEFSDMELSKGDDTKRFTQTGLYPVIITDAEYIGKDVEGIYANSFHIKIVCIDGEFADAECELRYWMTDNRTGKENWRTKNTLLGLGKALFGPDFKGIPHPEDMVGRVCFAEVTIKPTDDGKAFPRVYHFTDIDDYYSVFSEKPQYYREKKNVEL